ncbi:ABC transporter substrate-binding protein [Niallia alba]|uniref:ABC transporter substrate-binding protein n=1 Tax=Niallia alba TaxID=2729105 RepID=UPI002E1BC082|nr:ABC transporter substrate-binding protein [Niallia alba]
MDNKLLTLWRYYPSGSIRMEEISETLQISSKQTTRYLKKWMEEGWLSFTPGRGRGNISTLVWKKEVESSYEEEVLKRIDQYPVEQTSKYLMYNWSTNSKMRLMNKFHTKLGFVQESTDKLIVPKRYPFHSIHPLEAGDVFSAHLVANVFNRLVTHAEDGKVMPEIAHSWDISSTKLRLYLKKDIKFHDGSILTATDVADCLEKIQTHSYYKELWTPIEKIEIKSPHILDILHPTGCSYILPMLSMMCASIYRETKEKILGTGYFALQQNNDQKTTLTAFKDHFRERPLIDVVEFIQVPEDFKGIYHSHMKETTSPSFEIESDSGFGVIVMNAYRNSVIRRKEVRDYLHEIIAKNRPTIGDLSPRLIPNDRSIMVGQEQTLTTPKTKRPKFSNPIVIRGARHTANTTQWLAEIFEKENIPIEIQWFSFADTLMKHPKTLDVDIFVHGEVFESNQNFSFYHFLKNGFSPLSPILEKNEEITKLIEKYKQIPFDNWTALNLEIEKELINQSIMIPLYYQKRYIPFSTDIRNIKIGHFGYVDFSKVWVRPKV